VSARSKSNRAKNVTDLSDQNLLVSHHTNFWSEDEPGQWLCYDFKSMKVRPTHYEVLGLDNNSSNWRPESWVVEGSNDGKSWIEFDSREKATLSTFSISRSETVRMIRFRQTGPNNGEKHSLVLSGFEVFGSLFDLEATLKRFPVVPRQPQRVAQNRSEQFFPFTSEYFRDIIWHLTEQCGGNPHNRGAIVASAKSDKGSVPVQKAAELTNEAIFFVGRSCFWPRDEPDQWLCYDFKEKKVKPTHYAIMGLLGSSGWRPKRWVIEGSNDGSSWIELNRREDSEPSAFPVSRSEAVQMVRIRQIGLNACQKPSHALVLSGFEVFGSLVNRRLGEQ
jgi:hypothetical protein